MEIRQNAPALVVIAHLAFLRAQEVQQQVQATLRESRQCRSAVQAALKQHDLARDTAQERLRESWYLLQVSAAALQDGLLLREECPRLPEARELPEIAPPLPGVEKQWLNIPEAALRAEMTQGALRMALHKQRLPYIALYGRKIIRVTDLDRYRASAKRGRPRKPRAQDRPETELS